MYYLLRDYGFCITSDNFSLSCTTFTPRAYMVSIHLYRLSTKCGEAQLVEKLVQRKTPQSLERGVFIGGERGT